MPYMLTKTAKQFRFLEPHPDAIVLEDIAHALANSCRFNGHVKTFYSVAQHSVHVSYRVPPEQQLAALFHDAAEAYLGDIVSPLKALVPQLKEVEENIQAVIATRFHFDPGMTREIKYADLVLLATERRDLMPADSTPWPSLEGIEPLERAIIPVPPAEAKAMFLDRYQHLMYVSGFSVI